MRTPPLTRMVCSTMNLISETHYYMKGDSMHLWYSESIL